MLDSYGEELEIDLDDDAPYVLDADARAARRTYFKELFRMQGELIKLQDWVVKTGHKVVVNFEGHDAAGA